jgi:hypothetical protein
MASGDIPEPVGRYDSVRWSLSDAILRRVATGLDGTGSLPLKSWVLAILPSPDDAEHVAALSAGDRRCADRMGSG